MARALTTFITDPLLRADLRQAGLQRAKTFSWSSTAHATLEVYEHVLQRRGSDHYQI
jgi:glycosyltransferase involved in cell wall biosynthesis